MSLTWEPDGQCRGTAVLLHGVMALASTWWRIGAGLAAAGWRTHALDLPGHGSAPWLDGPVDLDTVVAQVADRIPAGPDLLVGHSLGGVVALALAAHRPDLARALVIEDPPGFHGTDFAGLADSITGDADLVAADRAAVVARERAANPRWAYQDIEYSVDGIAAAQAAVIAAALRERIRWDLPALLAAVTVPVLVLAPTDPAASALHEDRATVYNVVGADRFVTLDGGHCLHRDRPDDWLRVVSDFTTAL